MCAHWGPLQSNDTNELWELRGLPIVPLIIICLDMRLRVNWAEIWEALVTASDRCCALARANPSA